MKTGVLDAFAIMAFLEGERGADDVRDWIQNAEKGDVKLFCSTVNLGEVWYSLAREYSPEAADRYVTEIRGMAIEIVPADWELTYQAALFKSQGRLAYGDCFAAALAKIKGAELITGDKEFISIEKQISIKWI